jgi:Na+/H+ antiporter NhaD/arsenite permease-like protein
MITLGRPQTRRKMTEELGHHLSPLLILPFTGLLLSIALLPLVAEHWFEKNRNRALVAAVFGVPVVLFLVLTEGRHGLEEVLHTFEEYLSFIVLLGSLYIISGGIYLTGQLLGTPTTNLAFLLGGAVLANFIGTTGASMVLIRPLLRANANRKHKRHIVIFAIFLMANIGGLLTPLGDPPLFLGFLRGVDFFWTLNLVPQWLFTVGIVAGIFMVFEQRAFRKEDKHLMRRELQAYLPMRVAGQINILFLLGVVAAVLLSEPLGEVGEAVGFPFMRELVMVIMVALSLKVGPTGPRASNHFTWNPIIEVAVLFAGIFAAMIPALLILEARGAELGLNHPSQYFWTTGVLSSFLDNAPTYLTFTSTAQGFLGMESLGALTQSTPVEGITYVPAAFLAAISCGAVFMGANSYIGNAPNFMVKAIAEESGVKMPSFFGYMAYSALVLVPVFVLVTLVFFR